MPTSAWYQGELLKRLLQGAAVGVVATLVVGFGWGGWMLGSSAKTLADSTANSAVVAAIAPICVDQFQHSADAADNLTALKKTDSMATGGVCRERRLGDHAREQSGRFRRIASLRRHSQRREMNYERCVQHNGRRSAWTVTPSASLRHSATGMGSNAVLGSLSPGFASVKPKPTRTSS